MRSHVRDRRTSILALALTLGGTWGAQTALAAANPPLRRDLSAYFVFGEKTVKLKDIVLTDACNIGVNCQQPTSSSECGAARMQNPTLADGSQLAADFVDFNLPGGSVWQLFFNHGNISKVTVRKETDSLVNPILANVDGDANPSCGTNCDPDYGDLYAACSFPPDPFPTCGGDVVIGQPGVDCIPPTDDANLGNGQCDLAPGTYNAIITQNNTVLNFTGGGTGIYNICSLNLGKKTNTTAAHPIVINIPSGGGLEIGNDSTFGRLCGDITIFKKGTGDITFSHRSTINAKICGPEADFQLGHDNDLTGQFVGNTVLGDLGNHGHCCAGGNCTCFDSLSPALADKGDTITLKGECDLSIVSAVTLICGVNTFDAPIVTKSASELTFTVPDAAAGAGACNVAVTSPAGVYTGNATLTIH